MEERPASVYSTPRDFQPTHVWLAQKALRLKRGDEPERLWWEPKLIPVVVEKGDPRFHVTLEEGTSFGFLTLPDEIVPIDQLDEVPEVKFHNLSGN